MREQPAPLRAQPHRLRQENKVVENPVVALMQLQLEVMRQSMTLSSKIINVVVRNQPRMIRAFAPVSLAPASGSGGR